MKIHRAGHTSPEETYTVILEMKDEYLAEFPGITGPAWGMFPKPVYFQVYPVKPDTGQWAVRRISHQRE